MNIKLVYLSLKNLKGYYFVPIFVLYIIIPIVNIGMINMSGNINSAYILIFREAERFIPIMSIWWIVFVFKEYIATDGNEILYCIEESGKVKLYYIALIFIWYIFHVGILFLIYGIFWDNIFFEFTKITIQSFFFSSLVYMLIYTFKSTDISFMFVLIYELLSIFVNSKLSNYISIFENGKRITFQIITTKYLLVSILGILFLLAGVYRNKKFY